MQKLGPFDQRKKETSNNGYEMSKYWGKNKMGLPKKLNF
jgi:hypothetical protein